MTHGPGYAAREPAPCEKEDVCGNCRVFSFRVYTLKIVSIKFPVVAALSCSRRMRPVDEYSCLFSVGLRHVWFTGFSRTVLIMFSVFSTNSSTVTAPGSIESRTVYLIFTPKDIGYNPFLSSS